jgi:hypothetical protein
LRRFDDFISVTLLKLRMIAAAIDWSLRLNVASAALWIQRQTREFALLVPALKQTC